MAQFNDYPNEIIGGAWAAQVLEPDTLIPAGGRADSASFYRQDSVLVTVTATAAQNATSVSVKALSGAIPSGTVLSFGGAKFARLTANAAAAATSLTVAAIPTALAAADTARYVGAVGNNKKRVITSGTFVSRTYAERDANTGFHPAVATDDEFGIVAFENPDLDASLEIDLVKPYAGFTIYENRLPEYTTLNTAVSEVQTITITGTMSAGTVTFGDGKGKTATVAYNANLATCQTAFDLLFGASNTVLSGTIAALTCTFAADEANKAQTLLTCDISNATDATKAVVARTTAGGKPLLTLLRSMYKCITGKN